MMTGRPALDTMPKQTSAVSPLMRSVYCPVGQAGLHERTLAVGGEEAEELPPGQGVAGGQRAAGVGRRRCSLPSAKMRSRFISARRAISGERSGPCSRSMVSRSNRLGRCFAARSCPA